ncbi:MAG: DUF2130 domain-containing protein [Betaproteobacteria bacterium]
MPAHIIIGRDERIACTRCAHSFAISEGLSRQTIDRYAQDFEQALARRARDQEKQLMAEAKQQVDKARQEATALAREVAENEIRGLREAMATKENVLEGFRAAELELRRQLNDAEERRRNQEVEYQRRLDEERKRIEERAHATIAEDFQRREAQMKALIESSQREVADLKRKLEQGSQQTQGEASELTLEAMLRAAFPFDEFVPVPKGVNGADLLQRVRSPTGQVCGTIAWESKETKNWQPAWIAKLKDDQHAVGAELAVLVTAAMPKEVREPFVRESDVWVTRIEAARPLAEALRTTLLEVHKLRQANTGRHEKMELLYAYVHSPQFAQRMQAIGEAFAAMKGDLEAEKAAMMRIWKKREAQITRVTGGLMNVVGELQGLSEEALPELEAVGALASPEEQGILDEAAAA